MGNCITLQKFDVNDYDYPIEMTHIIRTLDIKVEVVDILWSHYKTICERYSTVDDNKSKNKDSSRLCELDNILYYLSLQDNLFNRYIFRQFNSDKNNLEVPFHDFVFGCWSFLGIENEETAILNYYWEILDIEGSGELKVIELMFLFGVFTHGEILPEFINKKMKSAFPGDALTAMTINEVVEFMEYDASIILPIMSIHRKLRNKLGGAKLWDDTVIKRRFQHSVATAWEIVNTTSKEKLCYWTALLEIKDYVGRKTPAPILDKLDKLQTEVGDAVLAKKQSEKDLIAKTKADIKARNSLRKSEIMREHHNNKQQKKKKKYLIEKAQLEASNMVRKLSKKLQPAEIDELNKIKEQKSKSERTKKMKRRNSFTRRLSNWGLNNDNDSNGTNTVAKKGGRKGKPAVYNKVNLVSKMSLEEEDKKYARNDIKVKLKNDDNYVNPNAKDIVYAST